MYTDFPTGKMLHLMRAKGLELFYKKGYYNTSIQELTENLAITESAFHKHFQSKADFFLSIAQNLILQRTLSMLIDPVSYKQSPFPLILELFEADLNRVVDNDEDHGFILANFIGEFNDRNPRISKILMDILKIWEINLTALLNKGKTDGFLRKDTDSESITHFIIASYFGIRNRMIKGDKPTLKAQYINQLQTYFHMVAHTELV